MIAAEGARGLEVGRFCVAEAAEGVVMAAWVAYSGSEATVSDWASVDVVTAASAAG